MINPFGDRVVIKPLPAVEEKSGLIIPESAKEKPLEGEIIACGPGRYMDNGMLFPMSVWVGQKVLYGRYSGTEIKLDGQDYLIMHQDDILGAIL
jgi:chaperonin GroES